ncbi:MAG: antibiotic biosynthesis monooxygenase [Pyrinomonadaceae bacterium]|nr:antibiotic biosynthesis monooxygenase [Pyrinomonadaceae bacterium]
MILNTTRITVIPGKRKELFQTVNQLRGAFEASKGCLAFHLYVDSGDEDASLLLSEWDTEADLNNHLRSENFAILHGAMAVLATRIDEFRALIFQAAQK